MNNCVKNEDAAKKFTEAAAHVIEASQIVQPLNNFAGLALAHLANALLYEASYLDNSITGGSNNCACGNEKSISNENLSIEVNEEIELLVKEIEQMIDEQ